VLRSGAYLLQNPVDPVKPHFFYGVYYTSQAMFQLGDNYWLQYRKKLHDLLLTSNPPRANDMRDGPEAKRWPKPPPPMRPPK